jgi:hypothetical protein
MRQRRLVRTSVIVLRALPAAVLTIAAASIVYVFVYAFFFLVLDAETTRKRAVAAAGWSMDVIAFNELIALSAFRNPLIRALVDRIYPPQDPA